MGQFKDFMIILLLITAAFSVMALLFMKRIFQVIIIQPKIL
ncbi:hypothetical protein NW067_01730 [Mycoplasmopsis cynos]|nr:hypothetical protein [Mycoplasmopsis cynos]UWV83317.1 hypothetical protein NW067_01730 [Mycoplasmopsis cynos]